MSAYQWILSCDCPELFHSRLGLHVQGVILFDFSVIHKLARLQPDWLAYYVPRVPGTCDPAAATRVDAAAPLSCLTAYSATVYGFAAAYATYYGMYDLVPSFIALSTPAALVSCGFVEQWCELSAHAVLDDVLLPFAGLLCTEHTAGAIVKGRRLGFVARDPQFSPAPVIPFLALEDRSLCGAIARAAEQPRNRFERMFGVDRVADATAAHDAFLADVAAMFRACSLRSALALIICARRRRLWLPSEIYEVILN